MKAFPGLEEDEAVRIIDSGTVQTVPENIVLCHEGMFETAFFIILEGKVIVTKIINAGETRILNHLSAGDFFGEMAIIHGASRAATVATVEPTSVLILEKDAFSNLLEESSSISLAMVREVSRRLRENDEMAIEDLRLKAKELALAYQQLAELEVARNEFLTVLAHELRTPLMAANGYLQMIQTGKLQNADLRSAVDIIGRHVQDITSLVNNLLFLQEVNLILPELKPNELIHIVRNVVDQYRQTAANNGITLTTELPPHDILVRAFPKSLERAIAAVLDNAIKFSRPGGEVTISVDQTGDLCHIAICDHGAGISPDIMPRIFDRFFHTERIGDNLYRGIGLGLSIAREVIEHHGGKIDAQSSPGIGSRFTISLPAM
jgi:signal transduction histidine kinase